MKRFSMQFCEHTVQSIRTGDILPHYLIVKKGSAVKKLSHSVSDAGILLLTS